MIGYPSGQDGAILPARDFLFCFRNKISPKFQRVHESFLSQNIFRVNENEIQENENVDEFQEYILPQKPANTKVKTQIDMNAWNAL